MTLDKDTIWIIYHYSTSYEFYINTVCVIIYLPESCIQWVKNTPDMLRFYNSVVEVMAHAMKFLHK